MEKLEKFFIQLREGLLPIAQFETWVYESEWLKEALGADAYESLLLVNFKAPHSFEEIKQILTPFIDEGKLEKKRLQAALESIITRDTEAEESLLTIYHAYSEGYFFLKELALNIATRLINPGPDYGTNNFADLTDQQKKDLLTTLYPQAKELAVKINAWLQTDQIILTGKQEKELGRWQYLYQRISADDERDG